MKLPQPCPDCQAPVMNYSMRCAKCGYNSEPSWTDKADQFTARVKAVHPLNSKDDDRHARYALAMEMIHSRHSKYELVDLVNWLLTKWPELQQEAKR